ncbi:MAG: hypothetical protein KME04_20790 [Pleurocapsa minor GSE-CHR-MK-17-07R]|jgi:hypothetical protein|nr:hypothetical protein [Pleurocapsa minor GSE-CHR-MK 17-07R]
MISWFLIRRYFIAFSKRISQHRKDDRKDHSGEFSAYSIFIVIGVGLIISPIGILIGAEWIVVSIALGIAVYFAIALILPLIYLDMNYPKHIFFDEDAFSDPAFEPSQLVESSNPRLEISEITAKIQRIIDKRETWGIGYVSVTTENLSLERTDTVILKGTLEGSGLDPVILPLGWSMERKISSNNRNSPKSSFVYCKYWPVDDNTEKIAIEIKTVNSKLGMDTVYYKLIPGK